MQLKFPFLSMARALKNLNFDMNCSTLQPEFGEETVTNLSHEKEDLQLGHGYCHTRHPARPSDLEAALALGGGHRP